MDQYPGVAAPAPTTILGKYSLGRLLGRGSFAKVYHALPLSSSTPTPTPVAIKIIDKSKLDSEMAPRILREVTAMRRLHSHPNILTLHEILATKSSIFLVMDLAPRGDLLSSLSPRPLPSRLARKYLRQLSSALRHSHRHGVAHRDVKPQNLLLDAAGDLQLADFGLSSIANNSLLKTACGTPAFAAPEVFERRGYDGTKADSWSCGVILYMFLVGGLPFDDRNLSLMYRKMKSRDYRVPTRVGRLARGLIHRLLDPNPETRMGVEGMMESAWLKGGESSLGLGEMVLTHEGKYPSLSSVNAFDLIGMNAGLDLSGLFDDRAGERGRRFTSREGVEAVVERVEEVGGRLGYEVEKGKGGSLWMGKGGLLLVVEVLEVAAEVVVVEVKVVESGGGVEGVRWAELRSELGDVVDFWHNERI